VGVLFAAALVGLLTVTVGRRHEGRAAAERDFGLRAA
jgi:hypothetical protein